MTSCVHSRQFSNGDPVLVHVEFEVFGGVQGVNFTKYCKEMCDRFGLKGWTKLSSWGTVQGVIQGERGKWMKWQCGCSIKVAQDLELNYVN